MNWESGVPPLDSYGQLSSINWGGGSLGPFVSHLGSVDPENGREGQLEDILGDLIVPSLAVSKSSMG